MRLHQIRDCYYTTNKGKTWIKKKTYNTEDEARAKGINYTYWRVYPCNTCGKVHASRIRKNRGSQSAT